MRKIISFILTLALLVTIAPVYPGAKVAQAASQFFTFSDFSTVATEPTMVNSNRINLSGTFSSVSSTSITYSVQRIVNGVPAGEPSNGSATPLITGQNFVFTQIELFEGLNEITVSGVSNANNGNGGVVTAKSYVQFSNVPVITDIEVAGGTKLVDGVDAVVSTPNPTIMIKATNAAEVVINGTVAFNGAGGTYIHSGLTLTPGLNKLEFVARNGSKSFAVTRNVVYFPAGTATIFNVTATESGTGGKVVQLDGQEVVQPFTNATIKGRILVRIPTSTETATAPSITLEMKKDTTTVFTAVIDPNDVDDVRQTTTYKEYEFTAPAATTGAISTNGNGLYTLRATTTYLGANYSPAIAFTVRDNTSPYISDIRQLYGVVGGNQTAGSTLTYASDTKLSNNTSIFQMPVYVAIDANNFAVGATNTETVLTAKVNGNTVAPGTTFRYSEYVAGSNAAPTNGGTTRRVFRIEALPEGEVQLEFIIRTKNGSGVVINEYTETRTIINSPISSIQIKNVYDGQTFNSDSPDVLTQLSGRLINFNTANASDLAKANLKFTLNGQTRDIVLAPVTGTPAAGQINTLTGEFVYEFPTNWRLSFGSNEIMLSGNANGIQVTTRLTVYLFSTTQPSVTNVQPVPFVRDPRTDSATERHFDDSSTQKFNKQTNTTFTTTEKKFDLLFTVSKLQNLVIKVDGKDYAYASVDSNGALNIVGDSQNKLFLERSTPATKTYELRLFNLEWVEPKSGPKSVTITAMVGSESYSQTITVTRELAPFEILSPMLPQEKVVNQNFLKVSIRAEGADRITIGKEDMTKKATEDLFRLEVKNLKAGNNTIKFTVYRGEEKLNGQFTVNYAADNTVGAMYKTSLSGSGKISAFKGELTMTFPKNTFLRQANTNPGSPIESPDLFDSQEILFGIADRKDGRTVKIYNDVSDNASGIAQDGTFKTVSYDEIGAAVIAPLLHFGFASNLFWIDPGYKTGAYTDGYQFEQGTHPYVTGNSFFSRPLSKWLEPSNKGTITIKYDSSVRDVLANNLSIWRYYNGSWQNIGGVVNPKNKTVTAPVDGFGFYAVKLMRFSYPDVIGHEYARNSVELMYARGLMSNKDFNEFGVYDNITRGEFAQLLVKMFQIPLDYDSNMTFSDVPAIPGLSNLWDYRYIETAARKGIIRGSGAQVFQPNEYLSREDAAVMIARAGNLLKNTGDNFAKDRQSLQKLFTDSNLIENYSLASVLAIQKAKFIEGLPNTSVSGKPTYRFDPDSPLKRSDAAIIAERVMRKYKYV
ncbi:S-layer homology domain-containing protein [Paenibacillus soyae]|uniref:S-layer homology domain-containing protein n=1 Tax=Paenibacillus soyae TaxID=2969249 RepID=A0A9X2MTL2_9BACL|nr:S-layer homology domain-containing protein [Paenibacillus soyae]MCR2806756.1 S-layer homology domain-containing protein [Paenibacillus soyae]